MCSWMTPGCGARDHGDSGIVHLLDGTDGSELWARALDGDDLGLRVATISGTAEAHVAVGAYTNSNGQRSGVYFFDPLDGTRVARYETEDHVLGIEGVDVNGDGNEEALTVAGLQIHAIDILGSEPEPDPTPTPTTTPTPTVAPSPTPTASGEPSPSPSPGGDPDRHEATGRIAAFNPTSNRVTGMTETEFNARCAIPASQGFDGYVFALPDRFGRGDGFAMVTGANAFGLYDLDAYFYSANCEELAPPAASPARDETGKVPEGRASSSSTPSSGATQWSTWR